MLDQDAKDKRVANDHHKSEGEDNQEEPLQIEPLGAHCGIKKQDRLDGKSVNDLARCCLPCLPLLTKKP